MLDEVEDLHDRRVADLGQELPLGHGDGLRLGVAGMHQTLEHHRSLVDVVVDGQVHPAQPAVRDAALDLVLVGDHVARVQLRHERIGAAAVRTPALGLCRTVLDSSGPPGVRSSSRTVSPRRQPDWSSTPRSGRSREPGESRPAHHRGGGSARGAGPPWCGAVRRVRWSPFRRTGRRRRRSAAGRSPGWPSAAPSTSSPCRARRAAPAACRRRRPGCPGRPSVHIPRGGRCRCRTQHRQPLAVQRVPRSVPADPVECAVDEADQGVFARLMPMPYGSWAMFGPMMCR